jgi:hypothetical protein
MSGRKKESKRTCKKPGYKYKSYFQHSNEPPLGPRMLRGIQDGWRYRRCCLTKARVKQDLDSTKNQGNTGPIKKEEEKSTRNKVLKKLEGYIEESSSSISKEGDTGKDYKKMYWDLIDNLRKIVNDTIIM